MSFIEVNEVSKAFRVSKRSAGIPGMLANLVVPKFERKQAVNNISFSIEQGEMVGFIGPNGAGKSTTIKMLSGILYPDTGSVRVNGYIPYRQRKEYVGSIGVVFGQKSQLQWDLPVIDSFELLKAIYRVPDEVYQRNLSRFTEMLDMSGFINQPVRQLSLGQRMRADIVAALLHSPQIVFFDEPTIGVDVVGKETIRNFICELNARDRVTMLFTTHDMQDIEKTCKRLIIID
ncbi:MAG: ATP-binding cassette domain-containing protein, partial [Acetatifactor sp.]|nr:ATP-binding cassette domain-containing protein [Acetatifactor sp.]